MTRFSIIQLLLGLLAIQVTLAVNQDDAPECPKLKREATCLTPQCIHSASAILKNMNESVEPCDDFYEFACGNFAKQHVIPDDQPFITGYSLLNDDIQRQIKHMLEEPIKDDEARSFVMAKTLYNLCYDTKTIDENGIAPIQSILTRLGGWPVVEGSKWNEENFNWTTTTYNIQKEGYCVYDKFIIYIGLNAVDPSHYMIQINQGQLELDRKNYLEGLDNEVVQAYYDYIVELAVLLGANKDTALTELKEVIDFEIEIAKIIVPNEERRNMSLNVNQMTIDELQVKFDGIPWHEYINNVFAKERIGVTSDEYVDVEVPSYITNLILLLNRTSERVLHNHLILHVVIDSVPFLSKKFKKAASRFEEIRSGTKKMMPRWMECVDIVNSGMKIAVSALYVRKYFSNEAKQNVEQLVQDIRDTFNDILKDIDWMDEETKAKALEKEVAMTAHVAYPEELLVDRHIERYYTFLNFSSHSYLGSMLKLNRFSVDCIPSKLKKTSWIDRRNWIEYSNSIAVNAYYAPQRNSILLPAGILQGVFFNNHRPHYMNYGSIGFVIGHEITHGFDDVGRQFDKNGGLTEWWGEKTKNLFMEKAQCFIDQYSNISVPYTDMHINGVATQGENIADSGGIKKAYLAYENLIKRNGEEPRLPGLNYTPKQLFWISAANVWCIKQRKANLKHQVLTDEHSPAKFRVNEPLRNSDSFARDFNCPLNSYMNPSQKCKIW